MTQAARRTIEDFGDQWTRFTESKGYYASSEILADICGPLLSANQIANRKVAEIGSGTGRIVNMLIECGAAKVVAIEPSDAFGVLADNTRMHGDKVKLLHARGDEISIEGEFEFIFSIGVLHHIPDPDPVVSAAYRALRPKGKMLVWLYGQEGNEAYLALVQPLRAVTTRLPHPLLLGLSWGLNILIWPYVAMCRWLSLPLAGYLTEVFGKFTMATRTLVIYDQLNPATAKYYTRQETIDLLERAGFSDIQLYHRHGYSWTAMGTKPAEEIGCDEHTS